MFGLPRREAWPWLAASMTIHIGYYITLVGAYRHGELGFTYPIMRGTAPLLVAMLSGQLIGEHLSLAAWLGVAGISGGVLLIGLTRSHVRGGSRRHALGYALANAAIIAAYTLVDGLGVRASGNALQYVALLFMLDGLPYFAIIMWQRRAAFADSVAFMKQRWPVALARLERFARRLRDRPLGHDQGAGRLGRGAARNLGPVRDPDRRADAEGALPLPALPRRRRRWSLGVMALRLA